MVDAVRAGLRIIATALAAAVLLACEPPSTVSETPVRPDAALRAFEVFLAIDRHVACDRAGTAEAFASMPPGKRLVAFTLPPNGNRTVSVVGRRGTGPWIDMISWQTGRAYAVAQPAALVSPWHPVRPSSADGEPTCSAKFPRRIDPDKIVQRADPSTIRATRIRNQIGDATVAQFATRGRTLVCLHLHMNASRSAGALLILSGLDCRDLVPGAEDSQWNELLPIILSLEAGAD